MTSSIINGNDEETLLVDDVDGDHQEFVVVNNKDNNNINININNNNNNNDSAVNVIVWHDYLESNGMLLQKGVTYLL